MSRRFRSQAFLLRQLELDFIKHEFAGRIHNRLWLFSSLLCRSVSTKKSTFQDIFACISAVYGSRFIVKYKKAAKAKLNHRSKL